MAPQDGYPLDLLWSSFFIVFPPSTFTDKCCCVQVLWYPLQLFLPSLLYTWLLSTGCRWISSICFIDLLLVPCTQPSHVYHMSAPVSTYSWKCTVPESVPELFHYFLLCPVFHVRSISGHFPTNPADAQIPHEVLHQSLISHMPITPRY